MQNKRMKKIHTHGFEKTMRSWIHLPYNGLGYMSLSTKIKFPDMWEKAKNGFLKIASFNIQGHWSCSNFTDFFGAAATENTDMAYKWKISMNLKNVTWLQYRYIVNRKQKSGSLYIEDWFTQTIFVFFPVHFK